MKIKAWAFLLLFFWSCKDKYTPEISRPGTGFLVVEGFINTSGDTTRISLTRSSGLDSMVSIPETGAGLEVQSESGSSFPLLEQTAGKYMLDHITVDPNQKYRLHIKTSDGKEYLSDFSEVKISPPIDSVNWTPGTDHLSVYVYTHDDRDSSRYYSWNYTETWEYNAEYISYLIYYSDGFGPRSDAGKYYTCYMSDISKNINLASSAKLSKDVIYRFPIANITYSNSDRLISRYSMEVRQTVLSKEAYNWMQTLQKNTEQLGSIFDPLPSQTGGNVHCINNPGEQVVGFVWCSSETTKRIFISRSEIPLVSIPSGYDGCKMDTIGNTQSKADSVAKSDAFRSGESLPLDYYIDMFGGQFVTSGLISCVDCRLHGGTIEKPSYW